MQSLYNVFVGLGWRWGGQAVVEVEAVVEEGEDTEIEPGAAVEAVVPMEVQVRSLAVGWIYLIIL